MPLNAFAVNVGAVGAKQMISVKLVQPVKSGAENAAIIALPSLVTPLPIVIFIKLVQFVYLQPVITQYFASNKSEIWS